MGGGGGVRDTGHKYLWHIKQAAASRLIAGSCDMSPMRDLAT